MKRDCEIPTLVSRQNPKFHLCHSSTIIGVPVAGGWGQYGICRNANSSASVRNATFVSAAASSPLAPRTLAYSLSKSPTPRAVVRAQFARRMSADSAWMSLCLVRCVTSFGQTQKQFRVDCQRKTQCIVVGLVREYLRRVIIVIR